MIERNESTHFWFRARRTMVEAACAGLDLGDQPSVIDVGCGTGALIADLFGADALGLDLLTTHNASEAPLIRRIRGSVEQLPLGAGIADLVVALDVLEHVDDKAGLREIQRVLRPGGYLVVTVPAHEALWSYRDDDAGHLRRYHRTGLTAVMQDAGFTVDQCGYFHGALLPALALARLAGRKGSAVRDLEDNPPMWVNRLLTYVSQAEVAMAQRGIRLPSGSSLLAVAQAPE
ncbi:MAG: methyltransferase domain-containing protein [Acidimicrobiaceae bacterium]|nr:methyltransferase domain-containing protein [Acidimicrobiaceae bacterium]